MPYGQANLYRESYQDVRRADIVKCIVTRTVDLGSQWGADVQEENGNQYTNVPVLNTVGGSCNAFTVTPLYAGQEVYVLKTSPNRPKFILGGIFKSEFEEVFSFVPFVPIEKEVDAICKNDYVVHNQDNQLTLSASNGIIIKSNGNARIQLGDEGKFKISKNGQAGEFILNAARFLVERKPYFDELNEKVRHLEETCDKLIDYVYTLQETIKSVADGAASSLATAPLTPVGAVFGGLSSAITLNVVPKQTATEAKHDELVEAPLRSSAEHTRECSKAINYNVLVPK
jgi:hypothetical protein